MKWLNKLNKNFEIIRVINKTGGKNTDKPKQITKITR